MCRAASVGPNLVPWFFRDASLAVGTESLYHAVHVAEKSGDVRAIQNCSIREASGTYFRDIIGGDLAGVARYLFREVQELFELWIDWSGPIIRHERICQIGIVEFFTEKLSVRLGSVETVIHFRGHDSHHLALRPGQRRRALHERAIKRTQRD